jgi:phosphoglycolate phosphatase
VDFDNTVFDWLSLWSVSINSMLEEIVARTSIDRAQLLAEVRKIHRRVGTSEYTFLLQELRPVLGIDHCDSFAKLSAAAISAYRIARASALRPYPTVIETLRRIKRQGATIVSFTESTAYHAMYRAKRLGLDGIFDALYSPPDHVLPLEINVATLRSKPPREYKLNKTRHEVFASTQSKPDDQLLRDILAAERIDVSSAIYVGDSLHRDVLMAQNAGVLDAHAMYGLESSPADKALLDSVSHWSDSAKASQRVAHENIRPTISLPRSFSEILSHVEFTRA